MSETDDEACASRACVSTHSFCGQVDSCPYRVRILCVSIRVRVVRCGCVEYVSIAREFLCRACVCACARVSLCVFACVCARVGVGVGMRIFGTRGDSSASWISPLISHARSNVCAFSAVAYLCDSGDLANLWTERMRGRQHLERRQGEHHEHCHHTCIYGDHTS